MRDEKFYLAAREERIGYKEFSLDLYVAFLKYYHQVTFPTALKHVEDPDRIGLYWLALAEAIWQSVFDDRQRDDLVDLLIRWREKERSREIANLDRID